MHYNNYKDWGYTADGTVRVYYANLEDLIATACERAVRNMSPVEWADEMFLDGYQETCIGKPMISGVMRTVNATITVWK